MAEPLVAAKSIGQCLRIYQFPSFGGVGKDFGDGGFRSIFVIRTLLASAMYSGASPSWPNFTCEFISLSAISPFREGAGKLPLYQTTPKFPQPLAAVPCILRLAGSFADHETFTYMYVCIYTIDICII